VIENGVLQMHRLPARDTHDSSEAGAALDQTRRRPPSGD
jgi:hypothetical protein